jgi:PAS domain S-box-containing protein
MRSSVSEPPSERVRPRRGERKRGASSSASRRLDRSEDRLPFEDFDYQSFVSSLNEGAVTLGRSGLILQANEAFLKILALEKTQIEGLSIFSFMDETERPRLVGLLEKGDKRGQFREVFHLKRAGGKVRTCLFSGSRLSSPGRDATCLIITDITRMRLPAHAEVLSEALEASESRFRALAERLNSVLGSITEGYLAVDREFRVLELNRTAEEAIFKRPARELIGRNLLREYPQLTGTVSHQTYLKAFETQKPIRFETRSAISNRWLEVLALPQGERMELYLRDIHERKEAEEQLRQVQEQLERGIHERTMELMSANEELQRSNSELEAFAYMASHDLQEPLRMVLSFVQILQQRFKDKIDPETDRMMGFIIEGSFRMKRLIEDLLVYSRIRSQKSDLKPTEFEKVLKEAVENLQMAIEEANARITHDPLPNLRVHQPQMVQLLQNLIANAIKFRKPDDVPHVHVSAVRNGDEWVFSVRDNGIGIEPEFHSRIFEMFQRLHARDKFPGTGIGLSVCKLVVEKHKGRIWVESDANGSIFHFSVPISIDEVQGQTQLPLQAPSAERLANNPPTEWPEPAAAADAAALKRNEAADAEFSITRESRPARREVVDVLVIDDNPGDYELIRHMLSRVEGTGFDVHWASTYESAMEAVASRKHDVYLVDYRLGKSSGLDFVREALAIDFTTPLIFMTGAGNRQVDIEATKVGAADYLVKGEFDEQMLERVIRYCLQHSRMLKERQRLERQVLEISEREQRRIGQDLHDGLGQQLTGLIYLSKALEKKLISQKLPQSEEASKITTCLIQSVEQARDLSHGLYPIELELNGLELALEELTDNAAKIFKIECTVDGDGTTEIEKSSSIHLYRICQEAIQNAIRHGNARKIEIFVRSRGRQGTLIVRDNGSGIPLDALDRKGMGLRVMKYRAGVIGGSLEIATSSEEGTTITCTFPCKKRSKPRARVRKVPRMDANGVRLT